MTTQLHPYLQKCVALILLCAGGNLGCAAAFKSTTQPVRVIVEPEGADVRTQGAYAGAAPTDVQLDRQASNDRIDVSAPGYEKETVTLQHRADTGWFVWDIATCVIPVMACVPLLADAVSGKWFTLDDQVHVKLKQAPASGRESPASAAPEATGAGSK